MKIKAHKESIFHQDEEVEQLVESIVFGCYTACQCFRQNEDLDRAFEFIKLAIQVVEEQGSGLGCLRKGDLYYTKWRILEELGKECELVDEIDRLLFNEQDNFLYININQMRVINKKIVNSMKGIRLHE